MIIIKDEIFKIVLLFVFMHPVLLTGQNKDLNSYLNSVFYDIDISQNEHKLVSDFMNLCTTSECEQDDSSCIVDAGINGFYLIKQNSNRISVYNSPFIGIFEFKNRNIQTIELFTSFSQNDSKIVKRYYKKIQKVLKRLTDNSLKDTYYSNFGFCGKGKRFYLKNNPNIPTIMTELGFIDGTRKAISITIRICKENK